MNRFFVFVLSILCLNLSKTSAQEFNLLSAENGARIVDYSSCDWEDFKAYFDADDDELERGMYCSASESPFPHYFTLELALSGEISSFEFNTIVEEDAYPGVSAKDVIIYALTSEQKEFAPIDSFKLLQYTDQQIFNLTPFQARRIKIEILSNYGNERFTELARIKAFGHFLEIPSNDSITGIWNSSFGEMKFIQTKPFVIGCYGMGSLIGQFTGRVLVFQWLEQKRSGFSSLILNEEENRLVGIWGDKGVISGTWTAAKISGKIVQCEEKPIVAQLLHDGRAVLFLPNLKSANSFSRNELKQMLQNVVQFLILHPRYKLMIKGYTDNIGDQSSNKALSELWAIKMKNVLVEGGIEESRLIIEAMGDSRPLASNQTLTGRMANNRIELIVESGR